MIDYQQFCQIKDLHHTHGLKAAQIAQIVSLDPKTVTYWLGQERFRPRKVTPRTSKLDPFKEQITQMLEKYPYSAAQVCNACARRALRGATQSSKPTCARFDPSASPHFSSSPLPPASAPRWTGGHSARSRWGTPVDA